MFRFRGQNENSSIIYDQQSNYSFNLQNMAKKKKDVYILTLYKIRKRYRNFTRK